VNLILVSVAELKLDFLPRMRGIELENLDSFETEVLAYNIIDISNEDEVQAYKSLRKQKKEPLTVEEIEQCRKTNEEPVPSNLFRRVTTAH
jgi:hypothetical protein